MNIMLRGNLLRMLSEIEKISIPTVLTCNPGVIPVMIPKIIPRITAKNISIITNLINIL